MLSQVQDYSHTAQTQLDPCRGMSSPLLGMYIISIIIIPYPRQGKEYIKM